MIKAYLVAFKLSLKKFSVLKSIIALKPLWLCSCFGVFLLFSQSCAVHKKSKKENKTSSKKKDNFDITDPEDYISAFDKFNDKAEKVFKFLPVPIYSHSIEAGNTFGAAKFNLFNLSKKDTISQPSILSAVATFSSTKRINISAGGELLFQENNYIFNSYFNYTKAPQYFSGIGNSPNTVTREEIITNHIKFLGSFKRRIVEKLYAGIQYDLANYFKIETDTGSYLIKNNTLGLTGGNNIGLGGVIFYDKRDNRYNPKRGAYAQTSLMYYTKALGSNYKFVKFQLDVRKYINHWRKHVIAIQATTSLSGKGAPFYELALMGSESQMRGYYRGIYRDNVLIDGQIEYRMPVWNRFGIVLFCGAGRVAESYEKLSFTGFNPNYGGGFRIKVDSKNNSNLRVDFGFGRKGVSGVYVGFTEAF